MKETNLKEFNEYAVSGKENSITRVNTWTEEVKEADDCCRCSKKSCAVKSYFWCFIALLFIILIISANLILIYIINERNKFEREHNNSSINDDICITKGCVKTASEMLTRIDFNVDPCDDFYMFACGNFIKTRPVPDDHYLRNLLQEIQDEVYLEMKQFLHESILDSDGIAIRQIKLLYESCLNESKANEEERAILALLNLLDRTGGGWPLLNDEDESLNSNTDLEYRLSSLFMYQVQPLLQLFITTPEKNASRYSLYMFPGSSVLESAYFLDAGNETHNYLNAYMNLQMQVVRIFAAVKGSRREELNANDLLSDLNDMVRLESDLANITREAGAEPMRLLNISDRDQDSKENDVLLEESFMNASTSTSFMNFTIDQLEEEFSAIKWRKLFTYIFEIAHVDESVVLVQSKEYIYELTKLIKKYPHKTIDNYLCWTIIARYMPYLGPQFRRLFSDFRNRVPDLAQENSDPSGASRLFLSRWKECVHVVTEGLDIPAIMLYKKRKERYLTVITENIITLISEIKKAFNEIIDSQQWLSHSLREICKERVNNIQSKIGIPKYLDDEEKIDQMYSNLNLTKDDVFVGNILKMAKHEVLLEVKKLDQQVNPDDQWTFHPLVANAFYEAASNNIIFPSGILKFPLISLERPSYLEYATLGVVVGHEIAHSMDSSSRKLMVNANGTSLWPNEILAGYIEKAKCFAQQFTEYSIDPVGEYLNGNLSLEENICDYAGLQQAYSTYKRLFKNEKLLPGLVEFNTDQLFFIQYAQIWCEISSDEGAKRSLRDNHSPGRFRANGVLVNTPQFARVFQCPTNSTMNPPSKCTIWSANLP